MSNSNCSPQGQTPFGVFEWAVGSFNTQTGCKNDCRYCYAKSMAIRFKRATPASWAIAQPLRAMRPITGKAGFIMYPSSHDLFPETLPQHIDAIHRIINSGHPVLFVSKPRLTCIEAICQEFTGGRDRILFRFSIGSASTDTLKLWKPGATSFKGRLESLKYAHHQGYQTSVSCEPMLDDRIDDVITAIMPFVSESVWVGKMNSGQSRLKINGCWATHEYIYRDLMKKQSDKAIWALYLRYKDNPMIQWKESIKKVVGLIKW